MQVTVPGRQLRMLDLASLPRDDAPPNELQVRHLLAGFSQLLLAIAFQAYD